MSTDAIRQAWLQWQAADLAQASANKFPQEALLAVAARYRRLSPDDREIIGHLLSEQLASADEDDRFLAEALIDDFSIATALPALRTLVMRLESQDWPGAPYEWAKVNRVTGHLAEESP